MNQFKYRNIYGHTCMSTASSRVSFPLSPLRSSCAWTCGQALTVLNSQRYKSKAFSDHFLAIFTDSFYSKKERIFRNQKDFPKFFMSCKQNLILNNRSFYGCFYLGPFASGQSITIANALRRTLLSELSGVAITAVEIEGVTHEYSSIPGVKDTVLDILLNIKEIVLKSNYFWEVESGEGFLQVRGPGLVRACDIKLPSYLVCVDPDQYIATLSEDGVLNMKFYISSGQNYYVLSSLSKKKDEEQDWAKPRKEEMDGLRQTYASAAKDESYSLGGAEAPPNFKLDVSKRTNSQLSHKSKNFLAQPRQGANNILYLDPVFMPVTKINYIVEQNPQDFSSQIVVLEIWTNGSLHPRKALYDAFKKLINIFSNLKKVKMLETSLKSNKTYKKVQSLITSTNKNLRKPVGTTLGFSAEKAGRTNIPPLRTEQIQSHVCDIQPSKQVILTGHKTRPWPDPGKTTTSKVLLNEPKSQYITKKTKCKKTADYNIEIGQKNNILGNEDIGILNLSLRAYSSLKNADIHTIDDLLKYSPTELLNIKNLGKRALLEIQKKLIQKGLY